MTLTIVAFAVATIVVLTIGPRLARVAEAIANRLELGQVIVGAVLLGVVTSLPGLVLTTTTAARGDTELAVANALGGVAAQTLFLAIADISFRAGTLSSHVPTREVTFQAATLMVLLALVTIGLGTADIVWVRVHPMSIALVVAYVGGLVLSRRIDQRPLAPDDGPEPSGRASPHDIDSDDDVEGGRGGLRGKLGELEESPEVAEEERRSWASLWGRFTLFAVVLASAGAALALSGTELADSTALSAGSVGVVLTAVATSTPELVTALAAARRGAIGLAAGDIIGGNAFDTLFIAGADVASPGSIFAGAGSGAVGLVGLVILLNGVLLAGLVRRGTGARHVDVESLSIVVIWSMAVAMIVF